MKKGYIFFLIVLFALFIKQDITVIHAEETTMGVIINEETFPDKTLRKAIKNDLDINKDNIISENEMTENAHLYIDYCSNSIQEQYRLDLTGLSKLTDLRKLTIYTDCIINTNEIQGLAKLKILVIKAEKMDQRLNLRSYIELEELSINAPINKLDLSQNLQLKKLLLKNVKMKEIKIENLTSLEQFNLWSCKKVAEKLEITNCPKLTKILTYDNSNLKKVVLSELPSLNYLKISGTKKLKKLQTSKLPKLREIILNKNRLKNIKFNMMPNLEIVTVSGNTIMTELDIRVLKKVFWLEWNHGKLKKIRVPKKNKLSYVSLKDNQLTGTWRLSLMPKLGEFDCSNNKIEKILGRNHKNLTVLKCNNNELKKLDLYNAGVPYIFCKKNPNAKLYLKYLDTDYHKIDKRAKVYYKKKY